MPQGNFAGRSRLRKELYGGFDAGVWNRVAWTVLGTGGVGISPGDAPCDNRPLPGIPEDTEAESTVDEAEDSPLLHPDELRLLVTEYATLREIQAGSLILDQTSASRREDVEFLRDLGLIAGQGQSVVLSDSGRRLLQLEPLRQSEMVLGFDRTMLGS